MNEVQKELPPLPPFPRQPKRLYTTKVSSVRQKVLCSVRQSTLFATVQFATKVCSVRQKVCTVHVTILNFKLCNNSPDPYTNSVPRVYELNVHEGQSEDRHSTHKIVKRLKLNSN